MWLLFLSAVCWWLYSMCSRIFLLWPLLRRAEELWRAVNEFLCPAFFCFYRDRSAAMDFPIFLHVCAIVQRWRSSLLGVEESHWILQGAEAAVPEAAHQPSHFDEHISRVSSSYLLRSVQVDNMYAIGKARQPRSLLAVCERSHNRNTCWWFEK